MVEVKVGQTFEKEAPVKDSMLAINVGSGHVSALSTPTLITLMEDASLKCLQQFLEPGMTSVGTMINMTHTSSTPRGMKVTVKSTITEVNGRCISFDITAKDEICLISEGKHERVIVSIDKFNEKTMSKNM